MATSELTLIADEIRQCTLCQLHRSRTNAVPGEGPADARIVLIGEGPGYHEDRQGRPFVGPSGQFLTELLVLAQIEREDVFLANVIKCRAPQNRDPTPDEIQTCASTYLFRQIELLNPEIIVTLGRFSMALYLPAAKISHVHGKPHRVGQRLIVPMLHPAAALHQPNNRPLIEADFRQLGAILTQLKNGIPVETNGIEPVEDPPVKQLRLL
ncbi:MAG: uracil-DNA glycosylase [Chloroflexaceae bacterium]|nr:uracil-DNA glycosylase [Chloroflexaceae bacterium]